MTRHWRRSLSDNGASGTPTDHHKKNRTYSETCTCKRSVSFMKESCRTLLVADPRSGSRRDQFGLLDQPAEFLLARVMMGSVPAEQDGQDLVFQLEPFQMHDPDVLPSAF